MFSFGLPAAVLRVIKHVFSLFLKKIHSRVITYDGLIEVREGLVIRRRMCFGDAQVVCVSVEQTLFMQSVKMYTLRAVIRGERYSRDKKVVLLPICTKEEAKERMRACFSGFLAQKDIMHLKGRHWLRKRELYCKTDDIGLIKLSKNVFSKGYRLKATLRSQTGYKLKIAFSTESQAQNYIDMYFPEFSEHNNSENVSRET